MAKQSKLDKAIADAQKDYDKALADCTVKGCVLIALQNARGVVNEEAPIVRRTRKAKGLPKPNGAEVTQ